MNETQRILLSAIAGGFIGTVFFGGLWWTVRHALTSRYAALWFTGGLLVRMSIALTGFYFVGRDHWPRLLACLFGFVVVRAVLTRLAGLSSVKSAASSTEAHHAS